MGHENKKFLIELITGHVEPAMYLSGYLTGIHDVGWIRRQQEKQTSDFDIYTWRVDKIEPRMAFSSMSAEEVEADLNNSLRQGLEGCESEIKDYQLSVLEFQ